MIEFELVLPAYNEALSLAALAVRTARAAQNAGYDPSRFQLVLVNNGSTDNSTDVLRELKNGEWGRWFSVVTVPLNQGYGFGLWSGLSQTKAPVIGWSHADEQCDPADAFKALELLKAQPGNNTLVKGRRLHRNWKDVIVSRMFELCARIILGLRVHEINAQPKVFPRALLAELKDPPKTFAFDLYVLYRAAKNRFSIKAIPVSFPPRAHGISRWVSVGRYRTIFGMLNFMWRLSHAEGKI